LSTPPGKRLIRLACIYVLLIAGFAAAMIATYALPQARMLENAKRSQIVFETEGGGPTPLGLNGPSLDNYTDALMVDVSITTPGRSIVEAAFLNEH